MKGSFEQVSEGIWREFALLNSQLEINIYETPIESELYYFELRVYGYLNVVVASRWTNLYLQYKSTNYLLDAYRGGLPTYGGKYEYEVEIDALIEKIVSRFLG